MAPQTRGIADEERVRAALEEVLARPEFREQRDPLGDAVGGILEDLLDGLARLFPDVDPSAAVGGAHQLGLVLVGLAAAGLLVLLARAVQRRRAAGGAPGLEAERRARVDELRARARAAEAAGDLTLALRLHFFALVVGLGQRGQLVYSDAFTNRELLERGAPRPEVLHLLRPLVDELDEHSFGRRPTDAGEVARFAGLCERLLGEELA
jgi:hypothetical protein